MNEKQKKWLSDRCNALNGYLEVTYPQKDEDWETVASYISKVVSKSGKFANEVRSALFKVTTKWELMRNGDN